MFEECEEVIRSGGATSTSLGKGHANDLVMQMLSVQSGHWRTQFVAGVCAPTVSRASGT